jgi:hypothetical protein
MWLLGKGVRFVAGLLGLLYFVWVIAVGGGSSWLAYQTQEEIEAAEAEAARRSADRANALAGYGTSDPSFRPDYADSDDFDESYGKPDRSADYTDGGWGAPSE